MLSSRLAHRVAARDDLQTDQMTERGLRYRQWVEQKREYVAKVSGGRLGYVHMYDMSAGALSQLNVDLDTDNHAEQGVVVDVRNNNGGFVNVYAIDVFARRGYFNMLSRGLPSVSSRTSLGQRALDLPTIPSPTSTRCRTARTSPKGTWRSSLGRWSASRRAAGLFTPVA
jgi:hypothetical protein